MLLLFKICFQRTNPLNYWTFLIFLQILLVIMQFSGITVLNIYAVKIFNEVFNSQGVSKTSQNKTLDFNCSFVPENATSTMVTSSEAYIAGICTVFVRLLSSLLLAVLLTKLRRRFMYLTSAFLTAIFLVSFATLSFFIENGSSEGKTLV